MNDELRPGDWVEVRPPHEIASTLNPDGTLEGMPFMPEMTELCGRRFRVLRRAEKTCVEVSAGLYEIREFHSNDAFLLEELRCSGAHHDGCQRLCMFLWKKAWLSKVQDDRQENAASLASIEGLRSKLRTKSAPGRYFCQSTQLIGATRAERLKVWEILLKCFRDVQSGAVGPLPMMGLIAVPLYRKVRDRLVSRPVLTGTLTQTPVGTLGLQPGEVVEIKPLEEMRATLDRNGRNRGLVCDIELKKFCGTTDRVRGRLERMISEPTGEMRQVEATVILEGNTCMCARVLGGCPRLEYCYWREIWLKRVEPEPHAQTSHN